MKGCIRPVLVFGLAALSIVIVGAQDRPLPDKDEFLQQTRKHLRIDSSVQRNYMYVETRRETKLDKDGRVAEELVRVFESYPGLPGQPRWERLISKNGQPVSAADLAEQDLERTKTANDMARRLAADPDKEHARQDRDWQRLRHDRAEVVDDIDVVYDITMIGRQSIEGHDTIAFSLTPKPTSNPGTREGEMMRRFSVRAWISETDHELVRLEAEAIDNLSLGFGMARLHKGAQLSFLRRKINDEVWLPAVTSYSGSARVGLLWTLRRTGSSEYSSYRKFTVGTSSSFSPPK